MMISIDFRLILPSSTELCELPALTRFNDVLQNMAAPVNLIMQILDQPMMLNSMVVAASLEIPPLAAVAMEIERFPGLKWACKREPRLRRFVGAAVAIRAERTLLLEPTSTQKRLSPWSTLFKRGQVFKVGDATHALWSDTINKKSLVLRSTPKIFSPRNGITVAVQPGALHEQGGNTVDT